VLQAVIRLRLGAEGDVSLEELAQPRPVRCDQELPALLDEVSQPGQRRGGIVE
jgi:hypothetical protein